MEITSAIAEKIEELEKVQRHKPTYETHLEGLLWAKPLTYWDYIQTDALLNLQTQRYPAR
jgi:tryptophan 2,3-dioxygenase